MGSDPPREDGLEPTPPAPVDAAIDGALRSERLRPTPLGLHRKIEMRVRCAHLLDRERRHFRTSIVAGGFAASLAAALPAVAIWRSGLPDRIAADAPGARGFLDRLTVSATESVFTWAGLAACGGAALAAVAALWAFRRPER